MNISERILKICEDHTVEKNAEVVGEMVQDQISVKDEDGEYWGVYTSKPIPIGTKVRIRIIYGGDLENGPEFDPEPEAELI